MVDAPRLPSLASGPPRPWLAALLSFLLPGLGQAYAGHRRLAVIFVVPVLLLAVGVIIVLNDPDIGLGNSLLSSGALVGAMVANAVIFAWRGIAVSEAGLAVDRDTPPGERRAGFLAVVVLLLATAGMHAWIGVVVNNLDETLAQVFAPEDGGAPPPDPGQPGASQAPDPTPEYRWNGTERINILLIGTDAAPGREATLTDVILLLSVDPVDQTAVLISVPRDTGYVPLPDERLFVGGVYPDKINEIAPRAAINPDLWCPDGPSDPQACGIHALETSVGLYLGVDIHHYALVDMVGFAEMIDAIGGVELCLPGTLVDPEFDGSLNNHARGEPLVLPAGCHHYDGLDALAYARSRKGYIEMPDGTRQQQSDFARSERQQRLLLAIRDELANADTLLELPSLLHAIGHAVKTDFPRDQAGNLASLAPLITGPDIDRVVLGYPDFVELPTHPNVNYLLIPKRDAIRDEMERLFGADALRGWYLGSDAPGPNGQPLPSISDGADPGG
jgi:LCP family protein required for cell wall assembly